MSAAREAARVQVADHEKPEWHAIFQEVLGLLANLNVKLPIPTLGVSEDAARSMTLDVCTYTS